jgi:soluble lytic murein transglycosylase-like protein
MRRVFAFQARGDSADAIRATAQLEDPLLLGTALANRYLGRSYRSTPAELTDWLEHYSTLPDAPAIHALLLSRLPKGTPAPPAPEVGGLNQAARPEVVPENMDPPGDGLVRDAAIDRLVMEAVQRGNAAPALRLIAADRRLSPAYAAQLRAEVAQFLFTHNQDAEALRIAQASLRDLEPRDQPSLGFFIAGLAAWRLDRLDVARTMFEGGADTPLTSPRLHAALAFWASRASRRLHDPVATVKWLQVAAGQPLTLHGFLARRLLRMPTGIVPSGQLLAQADVDAVAATPAGLRAFALFQIGQPDRAEAELRSLWPMARANPVFGRSLLMVAAATGLTDSAAQMAALLQAEDGLRHDELRFPVPRLRPAGGFSVDPALVYALTRLESNFNSGAVSPAGARGLMQIMPATAKYIMGDTLYEAGRLHEPATNLEIGQRYVSLLAKQDGIGGDLIRMLASYNCGPGNFLHWSAAVRDDGDPLLFMEAIPIAETRAFVPTALVYSWIYAARLHLPAPSLDSLAAGEFPRFTPSEQERRMAVLALELN